ncbi:uncharacterized protein LOC115629259 isoform X2 [Scaptodrosophila lebanonensis]|nr:uncharacterized protein LOC115629259 isoform X2 [Scaptodrosophila lebanonensis]
MVLRKPSTSTAAASFMANAAALTTQPMTRINHVNLMEHRREGDGGDDDNTKDSKASKGGDCEDSGAGIAEAGLPLDVQVSLQEEESVAPVSSPTATTCIPLRLHAIKIEQQPSSGNGNLIATQLQQHQHQHQHHPQSLITLPVSMAHALRSNMDWADLAEWLKSNSHGLAGSGGGTGGAGSGSNNVTLPPNHYAHLHNMNGRVATPPPAASTPTTAPAPALPTPPPPPPAPDADYSFLISLHPYLKEMSGKQNRRFRQKVVGLIDTVLDNADV